MVKLDMGIVNLVTQEVTEEGKSSILRYGIRFILTHRSSAAQRMTAASYSPSPSFSLPPPLSLAGTPRASGKLSLTKPSFRSVPLLPSSWLLCYRCRLLFALSVHHHHHARAAGGGETLISPLTLLPGPSYPSPRTPKLPDLLIPKPFSPVCSFDSSPWH